MKEEETEENHNEREAVDAETNDEAEEQPPTNTGDSEYSASATSPAQSSTAQEEALESTSEANPPAHSNDDACQKFKAIPSNHRLGQRSPFTSKALETSSNPAKQRLSTNSPTSSAPSAHGDRKFSAIPNCGLRHGQQPAKHVKGGDSMAPADDVKINEATGSSRILSPSLPGAFAVGQQRQQPNPRDTFLTEQQTTAGPDEGISIEQATQQNLEEQEIQYQGVTLESGPATQLNNDRIPPPESRDPEPEDNEAPMIVAELVEPPVEAVQVIYDEGAPQLQMNTADSANNVNDPTGLRSTDPAQSKPSAVLRRYWALVILCIVILVLAISIPLARKASTDAEAEKDVTDIPVNYPYECFTSTAEILQAQLAKPNQTQFIFCPNTHIKIGRIADATNNDTAVIDGDLPLMVLGDNVEVRCGLDGSVENHCRLDGGFAQILMEPILPSFDKDRYYYSTPNHNVTFRGLTFTGTLHTDNALRGSSVVASNRGKNITFTNCLWEDLKAPSGGDLVFVGNNDFELMAKLALIEPRSAEVILEDCIFRNIVYDRSFISAEDQSVKVRRCRFEGITLPLFPSLCRDHGIGDYCQGLVYCMKGSHCSMQDICVRGFEYAGEAAILVASGDAKVSFSGTHSIGDITLYPEAQSEQPCDSGFSRYWQVESTAFQSVCVSKRTLEQMWKPTTTCTLESLPEATSGIARPKFEYDCFWSTFELAAAQVSHPEQSLFIMCPNTTINLGSLNNPYDDEGMSIVGGDFPLAIVQSNVEVRCGLDGAVENNCVLNGGVVQVILSPVYPNGMKSNRTDNATIRGMTFSGQVSGESLFTAASVVMSNPGRNIQLVDCLWENISVPRELIFAGSSSYQVLTGQDLTPPHAVDLTISNCTFRNVMFSTAIVTIQQQNVTISGSRFEDLQLSPFLSKCTFFDTSAGWCQALMLCLSGGVCTLEDVCVDGIEYAGRAALLHATQDSEVHVSGVYMDGDWQIKYDDAFHEPCPSGLGWLMAGGADTICIDNADKINGTSLETCPLGCDNIYRGNLGCER